jgi:hypothetical protein
MYWEKSRPRVEEWVRMTSLSAESSRYCGRSGSLRKFRMSGR